jgi:hypothetical protein
MISRIDEQPTSISESPIRFRNLFKDKRSGQDRRRGSTMMEPGLDRRKGERRKFRTREQKKSKAH